LRLAAALGRDADTDLLAETAGLARRDVLAGLTPAVRQGLIGSNPQNPAEHRFVHVLVQQTLYAGLPPDQRLELHDRLATGLARRVAAEPGLADAAAHHAVRAIDAPGGRERAFTAACRAAALAAERLADETAAQWYTRALELAPTDPGLEVTLLFELGRVAGRSGHTTDARAAYDRAWATAVRADDRHHAAEAALGLGEVVVSSGTIDAGRPPRCPTTPSTPPWTPSSCRTAGRCASSGSAGGSARSTSGWPGPPACSGASTTPKPRSAGPCASTRRGAPSRSWWRP
jgi:hypothetical protein